MFKINIKEKEKANISDNFINKFDTQTDYKSLNTRENEKSRNKNYVNNCDIENMNYIDKIITIQAAFRRYQQWMNFNVQKNLKAISDTKSISIKYINCR
jgi:hypothetical protein